MNNSRIVEDIENFLREKVDQADAEGLVVGLSGGIDSALSAKLAVRALGSENVTALIMPGSPSKEENMEDARELADELGVDAVEINIDNAVEAFKQDLPFDASPKTLGNVRARSRMIYSYSVANERDLLVLGTGNRTELLLGYFTKYGDGATDIAPLLDLYKTEVREIAEKVGLDRKFIEKEPTAGLWKGQTDEEEIGASYENADSILREIMDNGRNVDEISQDLDIDLETIKNIKEMYQNSEHKRKGVEGLELFDERN